MSVCVQLARCIASINRIVLAKGFERQIGCFIHLSLCYGYINNPVFYFRHFSVLEYAKLILLLAGDEKVIKIMLIFVRNRAINANGITSKLHKT